MEIATFWTLSDDDGEYIDGLAAGLGRKPARVLAYLALRQSHEEIEQARATQLMIRLGTDLSRKAVTDALSTLEERNLVTETSIQQNSRGRPPKAWQARGGERSLCRRVYETHAAGLLDRAVAIQDLNGERGSKTQSETPTEVALGLNWQPNPLHVPLYAGSERGAYADQGITLTCEHYRGSHRALGAVTDGRADVGVVGAGTVAKALEGDVPVVPIAVLYQRATSVLYTTREQFGAPLDSVERLEGSRIATAAGSETCLLARLYLAQAGLLDTVELVDAEAEEAETLLTGRADVATGSFSDPLELTARGMTVDTLPIGKGFPIYGPTLVASEESVREARSMLERFLAATTEGWAEARRDIGSVPQAIDRHSDKSAETIAERFEYAVDSFATSDAVQSHGWGWQRPEIWSRITTALVQSELLDGSQ